MTEELKASWSRRGREKAEEVEEKEAPGFLEASIPPSSLPTYGPTFLGHHLT